MTKAEIPSEIDDIAVTSIKDVEAGRYYTQAIAWAAKNGIVTGVSKTEFNPDGAVTREQMAAILYRYCAYAKIDTKARAELKNFPDASKVSNYAKDPMQWAVAEKLINGTADGEKTVLDPQGGATRAQVATILMRFVQNFAVG